VWDAASGMGELNPWQFEAWRGSYICLICQPDFPMDHSGGEENEYVERSFCVNETKFYADLTAELQDRMGDDVGIEFRKGCFEFECIRKTYKHPVYAHSYEPAPVSESPVPSSDSPG
jgi:hypothetical protein